MKNLIQAAIATSLTVASLGAVAGDKFEAVKTLKVTPSIASYAENAPSMVGEFKVAGPIYTREIIGFESDGDAIYGDINGVVTTREIVAIESDGDAVYGDADGIALALSLTQAQRDALNDDDN